MIESDVGGGFGVRGEFYVENFLVPYAARKLKRPVKWIEDRRENLLGSNHSREIECTLEIVCERNGRILALRGAAAVDCGAYMRANAAVPARNVAQFLSGSLRHPEHRHRVDRLPHEQGGDRHLPRAGAIRGGFLPRADLRHRRARASDSTRSSSGA